PEGPAGVGAAQEGQRRSADGRIRDRAGRALRRDVGDEGVAVEAFTAQRHEELPGADAAAVRGQAREQGIAAFQPALHVRRRVGEAHADHSRSPTRLATRRRSLKSWRTPAISWYSSCPLPATSTTSRGPASRMARTMAAPRSGSTDTGTVRPMPERMSAMILSGSSPRGLSLVTKI